MSLPLHRLRFLPGKFSLLVPSSSSLGVYLHRRSLLPIFLYIPAGGIFGINRLHGRNSNLGLGETLSRRVYVVCLITSIFLDEHHSDLLSSGPLLSRIDSTDRYEHVFPVIQRARHIALTGRAVLLVHSPLG